MISLLSFNCENCSEENNATAIQGIVDGNFMCNCFLIAIKRNRFSTSVRLWFWLARCVFIFSNQSCFEICNSLKTIRKVFTFCVSWISHEAGNICVWCVKWAWWQGRTIRTDPAIPHQPTAVLLVDIPAPTKPDTKPRSSVQHNIRMRGKKMV